MTLQHAALPVNNLGCGGGAAVTIERTLRRIPGVTHVYVNPITEMAYVEFDREQCDERKLTEVLGRAGYDDVALRRNADGRRLPASRLHRGVLDDIQVNRAVARSAQRVHRHISLRPGGASTMNGPSQLRTMIATTGFLLIAAFFLTTEHRAHLFGALPFLLILVCPLLHLFMHGGHGAHDSPRDGPDSPERGHGGHGAKREDIR